MKRNYALENFNVFREIPKSLDIRNNIISVSKIDFVVYINTV